MAKKSFGNGFESVFDSSDTSDDVEEIIPDFEDDKNKQGIKLKSHSNSVETVARYRTTFHATEDLYEQVQAVAYWERQKIKDVINTAVAQYLEKKGKKYMSQALNAYRSR